ncbi:MAG: L-lactate dehydrogenase [Ruminococcaceae bacterium]|nr:L-lactate dehydrogenase [Oscillospiraceae bacterium]
MQKKITIIGAGSVGATTAFALLTRGAASEVVLIDVNKEKALGEALDIKQATPFIDNCDIYAGSYEDAVGSDVVIITSGIGRRPGQTRLELVQTNIAIIKEISGDIVKAAPNAIYIIVANPVDILTYAFLKYTGLPKNQVFGTGTVLDTIRLRTRLAEIYSVNKQQVHANVLGEHGDTSFVAWSTATIAGVPLHEYNGAIASAYNVPNEYTHEDVETYVRKSGGRIISRKGCTVYGIGMTSTHIVKSLAGSAETAMTVSSLHEGEYGISDVCLSSLTLIDHTGVRSIIAQKLTDDELAKLHASAEALKDVIKNVKF